LLANKDAQKHTTSKKELDNMRALIARDLADASLAGLSADRRFATAYNADKQTIGLLQRRHVRIEQVKAIGKESNSLEEVESGLMHSELSVYTLYEDPRRDEWQTKMVPALQAISLRKLQAKTGLSREDADRRTVGTPQISPKKPEAACSNRPKISQENARPRKETVNIYAVQGP
jgi:hypothetical protein